MKVQIKRFNRGIPGPSYEKGAAGFDFITVKDVTIKPGEIKAISGNVAMKIPQGYVIFLIPRSSTAVRYGISMPHSMGVLDPFYSGDDNEIFLIFHNFSKKPAKIKKGDRIAQGVLIKTETVQFVEVEKLGRSRIQGNWKTNLGKKGNQ
jgi:dUTP pyrophosphatase